MVNITSKADVTTVTNPLKTEGDAWADFRLVERLHLEMTQTYKHSLGKYSRFFIELENQRFMATTCGDCASTFAPPRPLCPNCLKPTQWIELKGRGTLKTWSIMHFGSGVNDDVKALKAPYVLAYVLLDGATTLFPHILHCEPSHIKHEMRVRVAYAPEHNVQQVQHPIHLMHYVPLEEV